MNSAETRVCYIHIGTHKTGSSAVQRFVMDNADLLRAADIFVPRLGYEQDFLLGGHVNLARELSGDILFNAAFGTLDDVLERIRENQIPSALLTSELFEFLYEKPAAIQRFADAIAAAGYQGKVIVYLRPRDRYIESLYSQLLRHGFDCPFDEYLDYILARGRYDSMDKFLSFQFEYAKILEPFARSFGPGNLIIKRYGDRFGSEFLDDFLDTIHCAPERRKDFVYRPSENETLSFIEALALLYHNAQSYAQASGPTPADLLQALYDDDHAFAQGAFSVIDHRDAALLAMRFARDRIELSERYGIDVPLVQPITDVGGRKKRRHALREAALRWGLGDYRRRCQVRYRSGMLPLNVVEAAAAATECPS